jgi:hypothetical protein
MAKRGGDGGVTVALGLLLAVSVYAYVKSGRGKANSWLIPDAVEDPIDRVIEALNQKFGHKWVNFGLNAVQIYIERTIPGAAALVNGVFRAEQVYNHYLRAGGAKKQYAQSQRLLGAG